MSSDRFVGVNGKNYKHGTVPAYQQGGCRCEDCRDANAVRARLARELQSKDREFQFPLKKVPDEVVDGAACRGMDPDLFFPLRGHVHGTTYSPEVAEALAACGRCEVRQECLEHALDAPERTGIWGGTFERQRRELRRERRKQQYAALVNRPAETPVAVSAPTERVIGIPHSRNTFLGDRIA